MFKSARFALVLALSVLPSLGYAQPKQEQRPQGRLQLVATGSTAAFFVALDQTSKAGDVVDAWIYSVYDPPVTNRNTEEVVQHKTFDCEARAMTQLGLSAFSGDQLNDSAEAPPGQAVSEPVESVGANFRILRMLCDGVSPAVANIANGHAEALKMGRQAIEIVRSESK